MFTRHIIKTASPEQVQAALQAGTLAEPYISLITQDSSVEGYESKGLYVQLPEGGAPGMFVKEYTEEPLLYLTDSPSIDYIGGNVMLRGQIHFDAGWDSSIIVEYGYPKLGVVPANVWDERAKELETDSSAEIAESFLNEETETYDGQYIAEQISTRSMSTSGSFKSSDDLEINIPFENEVGYNPETEYYIIGGFYKDKETGSPYSYNLGKYVLDDYLTDDRELIEFDGVINGLMNDEFNYWGGITQNSIYPRVAVGFYLQSVFDASFQAAYALDRDLTEEEFLITFRDSSMVDVHYYTPYQDGNFYGFDENNLFNMKNYPGFTNEHGDVLKMIGWLYDEDDKETDTYDLYSQPTLAVEVTAEDNQATVTAGDNFVDDAYDFILFKVLTQTELDAMVQAGYVEEDAYPGDVNAWLRDHNAFDGSLGEGDSSTFEFDTTESANNIYIVGAMYDTDDQQQEYIRYCDSVQYAIDLNDLVIPDSSGDTSTGWNIDPSTAWYLDVDFHTNGTEYYTDSASVFSEVLANEVNVNVVSGEFSNIYNNNYDYALTLVVDPDSYSYGIFQGGRRIPGRIVSATKMIFEDAYISEGQNTYLAYAYNDGTDNHYVCIAHAGFDGDTAYVTMEFAQGEMTMSYTPWRGMPNTWPNFSSETIGGITTFSNNFGMSKEEIDTTYFEDSSTYLQVAHFFKDEYDAVKDSSTFIENEFLNAHSSYSRVFISVEGDVVTEPFVYDPSTDELPVHYYVRLCCMDPAYDASNNVIGAENMYEVTQWNDMEAFPGVGVDQLGDTSINADSSTFTITIAANEPANDFGYTSARMGLYTSTEYDTALEGGMSEEDFFISKMTTGPVVVSTDYQVTYNITENNYGFIAQSYNPTTNEYWPSIQHVCGFEFPERLSLSAQFNDQTYVVSASVKMSPSEVNDGWTQYKYGVYNETTWEDDVDGIQEQYGGDMNAYRLDNVKGTNSYTSTSFSEQVDSNASGRFVAFAVPYKLDEEQQDTWDWDNAKYFAFDVNVE